jgi:hypothetical protein
MPDRPVGEGDSMHPGGQLFPPGFFCMKNQSILTPKRPPQACFCLVFARPRIVLCYNSVCLSDSYGFLPKHEEPVGPDEGSVYVLAGYRRKGYRTDL